MYITNLFISKLRSSTIYILPNEDNIEHENSVTIRCMCNHPFKIQSNKSKFHQKAGNSVVVQGKSLVSYTYANGKGWFKSS